MSFPRSYHVLYLCAQVCNIGVGLGFGLAALFGVKHSAWWYLTVLLGWLFFGAWRLVGRREVRRMVAESEQLCAELDASLARSRKELEQ